MSQLPRKDSLQVEEVKVVGYLLDLEHEDGGSKAKFFRNRGFVPEAWTIFADALRTHGATQPVAVIEKTRHGEKFTVECTISTPDGRNPCILSVWIVSKENPPRLVTAHPNS
jgi:hypothetical protein